MNPHRDFVVSFANLLETGKSLSWGGIPPPNQSKPPTAAPRALIFSSHPDDESLIGGFALRLMREARMRIINVAVTQGSHRERQAGEVKRNPYHLRMPAWLQDNVRRSAELVGGQGGASPHFAFATLYRLGQWKSGHIENVFSGGKQISATENPANLLNLAR